MGTQLETSDLLQSAVLWAKVGIDKYSQPILAQPVSLAVRWISGTRLDRDPQSDAESINATIFTDRELPIGSLLWQGKLENLPKEPTGIVRVLDNNETPDIKGRNVRRSVVATDYPDGVPITE